MAYSVETAQRFKRIYMLSETSDPFLRTGFRVAGAARNRLNEIATDVLGGIEAAYDFGAARALEASVRLEPKRAMAKLFGVAVGAVLCGETSVAAPPDVDPWRFVLALGTGFGWGKCDLQDSGSNAVLTGKGLYLAYWHWRQYIEEQTRDAGHPATDRGLGAMIWLGSGADPLTAASIAHSFSNERRPDTWKGLGFALSFLELCELKRAAAATIAGAAGPMVPFLIDGIAFGAFQRMQLRALDAPIERLCVDMTGRSAMDLVHASQGGFADWM